MCPARDLIAIYSLHSLHWIQTLCLYPYEGPPPVILLPYATSDCVPAAWHGRKTMPTVFPTLVCRPTLLNRPTKVLKDP